MFLEREHGSHFVEITQQRCSLLDVKIGVTLGSTLVPILLISYNIDPNKSHTWLNSIHSAGKRILYLDIYPSTDHTSLINSELAHSKRR